MEKGKNRPRKRKKDEYNTNKEAVSSESENGGIPDDVDKYKPYRIPNYVRTYPEDGANFEYIVFYESTELNTPIGMRDMMNLANILKKYNKGIRQLTRINKYKIGAIFETFGLANVALNNQIFLENNHLRASVPASACEATGVIRDVPTKMSNKEIYSSISCSKNVINIRRFMRRHKEEQEIIFTPTTTVALTFSCPVLPESVNLNSWLHKVSVYVPPVKQCLKCLRFGHIAKFCKNSEKCSICAENHNYKECQTEAKNAKCYNCKGNHVAISAECPIKKEKVNQSKTKSKSVTYAQLFNEKSFPPLKKLTPSEQFCQLIKSDHIMDLLTRSIVKLLTLNKTSNQNICSQSIKDTLLETIQNKKQNL